MESRRKTIAVVDDSPAAVEMIEKILRAAHYDVVTFQETVDLEDRIEELQPRLVLLDVVMPQRSGFDVLRKLRKRATTADIPVVLVSSKSEPSDVQWGIRQGASGYLPKPFTDSQLLETVGGALAG